MITGKNFKNLSTGELAVVKKAMVRTGNGRKLRADGRSFTRAFTTDGNFTTCLLKSRHGLHVGSAKRNPIDPWSIDAGNAIALTRATRDYILNRG